MSDADLSLIIVGWETRELTLRCVDHTRRALEAVRAGRGTRSELIVVDNGSRDGSVEALRRLEDLRLVSLPENRGFAGGVNAGLASASGRLVAIVNSDAFLGEAALLRALDHLASGQWKGVAGVQLLHPDGRLQNSIHVFPGLRSELVPSRLRSWLWPGRFPSKRRRPSGVCEIEAPLGAVLFVHREVLDAIAGLDEGYFFFLEETDFCWRAREAGFRVVHLPDVEVVHCSGASSKRRDAVATRIEYHRSLYRFVRMRRGRVEWALFVAVRQLRSVVALSLLALASPFSARLRGRMWQRARLLAWHLRGQPADAGLSGRASGSRPEPIGR